LLLDLDADDDRPPVTRIVAQLHRDDIDRLHDVMRDVRTRGDAQSVDVDLTTRDGAFVASGRRRRVYRSRRATA
jgi:Ser/Thr protein kinase RdoA (MazF antagonist)